MARVAKTVMCSDEDRAELERLSRNRSEQARLADRAKITMLPVRRASASSGTLSFTRPFE